MSEARGWDRKVVMKRERTRKMDPRDALDPSLSAVPGLQLG